MDDFELDQDEPFSPVKVLIVGSLMLVLGLGLVTYPAYRVLSSGSDSGAGTLENARPFTCIGCEPTGWSPGDDPPTGPARPAPNGTGTEAADAAPPSVASLPPTEASTTPTPAGATASGAPATATTAPAITTSPPAPPAASAPPAPASTAPPTAPPTTAPAPAPAPAPPPTEPQPGRRLGQLTDFLRDLLKGR